MFKVWWEISVRFCSYVTAKSNSEKILKINHLLPKLWTKFEWHIFLIHSAQHFNNAKDKNQIY